MGETDRELLELAAKAAGIAAYWSVDCTVQNRPILVVKAGGGMGTMPYEEEWNPLRDDATALRLAVKLGIHFCKLDHSAIASREEGEIFVQVEFAEDPYAATRRAIVRAAAATARHTEGA